MFLMKTNVRLILSCILSIIVLSQCNMESSGGRTDRRVVDKILYPSETFRFDEHGLASGGPFPYFPSNGALLTAVAMMAAGWDGSVGEAPGFPKNGNWVIRYESFNKMQ
jgi:hypothetical protein